MEGGLNHFCSRDCKTRRFCNFKFIYLRNYCTYYHKIFSVCLVFEGLSNSAFGLILEQVVMSLLQSKNAISERVANFEALLAAICMHFSCHKLAVDSTI